MKKCMAHKKLAKKIMLVTNPHVVVTQAPIIKTNGVTPTVALISRSLVIHLCVNVERRVMVGTLLIIQMSFKLSRRTLLLPLIDLTFIPT